MASTRRTRATGSSTARTAPPRPTRDELLAAAGRTVPDVIAPNLDVLFCGINPGLYTAAVGHHFARPGNRFWPALHASGFTRRLMAPHEEHELPELGLGITNVVERATAAAAALTDAEYREGARALEAKVFRYAPRFLAVLGVGAYRTGFARPHAALGRQPERIGGTVLWVLPNPSGLNAHFTAADLARLLAELREHVRSEPRSVAVREPDSPGNRTSHH